MNLNHFFSSCFILGHAEPIKVIQDGVFRFECPNCCADLGSVLPNQKFKARKVKKARKRKSAEVLHLQRKQA